MIKETLKSSYSAIVPVNLLAFLVLSLGLTFLTSCRTPKRDEINATLWLNNSPLPSDLCIKHKELNDYGFYRKLDSGSLEFISFCNAGANQWISMHHKDFDQLMEKYVPRGAK